MSKPVAPAAPASCAELVYELELELNQNYRYTSAVRAVACLAGSETQNGADLNLLRREDLHCLLDVLADGLDRQRRRMDNLLGHALQHGKQPVQ